MTRFRILVPVLAILLLTGAWSALGSTAPAGRLSTTVSSLSVSANGDADENVVLTYWQLFRSMWGWTVIFLVIAVALTYRCWRHYFHDITEERICPMRGESGNREESLVGQISERLNAESFVNDLEDRKATLDVLREIHDQLEKEPSIYARVMHRGIEDLVEYLKAVYYKKRAGDSKIKAGYYRYSEVMKPGMAEEMLHLSGKLERKLYVVDMIAATAPMIGLLGTVWGMIQAFEHIAASKGQANAALLGGDISVALWTTFAGLLIAIPAMYMSGHLKARFQSLLDECEMCLRRSTRSFWGRYI